MRTFGDLNHDVDEGDPEMADEVRAEITRILRSAGLTPAQARNMSLEVQTRIHKNIDCSSSSSQHSGGSYGSSHFVPMPLNGAALIGAGR